MTKMAKKITEIYLLFYLIVFTGFRYQIANPQILYYNGIILLLLGGTWLGYLLIQRKKADVPRYLFGYVLFGIAYLLSTLRSVVPYTSFVEIILWVIVGFIFFGVYQYCKISPENQRSIYNSLLWVVLIFGVMKCTQMIVLWEFRGCQVTHNAVLVRNKTASFLALGAILSLVGILKSKWDRGELLPIIVFMLSTGTLFWTGSRGGMIALIAGVAVVLLAYVVYTQEFIGSKATMVVVFMLVYVVVGILINRPPVCEGEITASYSSNVINRYVSWRHALDLFSTYPGTGSGPGTFPVIVGPKYDYKQWTNHPHNVYLNTLAETGLVGFTASALLALTLFKTLIEDLEPWRYKALGMGALTIFFVHGFVDVVTTEPYVLRLLVVILALAISHIPGGKHDQ